VHPEYKSLLKRIADLTAQRDVAVALLRELEWCVEGISTYRCPDCGHKESNGHGPNCKLAAILKSGGE
jgi:hypothetical protein